MAPSPDDPATVATARTEFEANVIAETLRAAGIEARVVSIAGAMLTGYLPSMEDPIKVLVRSQDVAAARASLARTRSDSVDIAWDELDVGEPADALASRRPLGIRRWMRSSTIGVLLFSFAAIALVAAYAPLIAVVAFAIVFVWLVAQSTLARPRTPDSPE